MKIGYARVSTDAQETHLQMDALTRAKCARIYQEKASGAKAERPELMKLLDHARKGDVVIVWKLDRLARSLRQLIEKSPSLEWLLDRKRRGHIKHRLDDCAYITVRNRDADDGLWVVNKKRQVIYARLNLNLVQRERAAHSLCGLPPW